MDIGFLAWYHSAAAAATTTTNNANIFNFCLLTFLFNRPTFLELLQVRPGLPKINFSIVGMGLFRDRIPFLVPNQHCHKAQTDKNKFKKNWLIMDSMSNVAALKLNT